MRKILVTGANGQLGRELFELTRDNHVDEFLFVGRAELDMESPKQVQNFFNENYFDLVINCAAYTAVDRAESETEIADLVNHQSVAVMAHELKKRNTTLIHISTDYVFDGTSSTPYKESAAKNPQSVYGLSKSLGEQAILESGVTGIVIRTSWVYSCSGNNFVKTMLRLGRERENVSVISDQVGTPTSAHSLAETILLISNHPKLQLFAGECFHYSNEGVASWYDFARAIMLAGDLTCHVVPIETRDYPTPAQRPAYSLLNKTKIKQTFGIEIPHWQDALAQFPFNDDHPAN